jgi:hypothetical protein
VVQPVSGCERVSGEDTRRVVEGVDVLLRQETAVSDVLLRHTSDVLLRVLTFC